MSACGAPPRFWRRPIGGTRSPDRHAYAKRRPKTYPRRRSAGPAELTRHQKNPRKFAGATRREPLHARLRARRRRGHGNGPGRNRTTPIPTTRRKRHPEPRAARYATHQVPGSPSRPNRRTIRTPDHGTTCAKPDGPPPHEATAPPNLPGQRTRGRPPLAEPAQAAPEGSHAATDQATEPPGRRAGPTNGQCASTATRRQAPSPTALRPTKPPHRRTSPADAPGTDHPSRSPRGRSPKGYTRPRKKTPSPRVAERAPPADSAHPRMRGGSRRGRRPSGHDAARTGSSPEPDGRPSLGPTPDRSATQVPGARTTRRATSRPRGTGPPGSAARGRGVPAANPRRVTRGRGRRS